MSKFKVGDKIRHVGPWKNWPDSYYEITEVLNSYYHCGISRTLTKQYENYFELVEEKQMFDMKNNYWFIEVHNEEESKAAQQFAFDNGVVWCGDDPEQYYNLPHYPCKIGQSSYDRMGKMAYGVDTERNKSKYKEIKLTYKTVTTVDKVEWPVVESETQKKLRELEEQQRKIAEDIAKLRESL